MKKNLFIAFSSLIMIPTICSCGQSGKIQLFYGQTMYDTTVELTYEELASKIDDKENFFVVTTPASNCGCWVTNQRLINSYIEDNDIFIYTINYSSFQIGENKLDRFDIDLRSDRQTYAIFDKGELVKNIVYDSKDFIFSKEDSFEDFMEETFSFPEMFYLSKEQLDYLSENNYNFVIYFSRSNCGDCTYIDKNFLQKYSLKMDEPLYILDCETIPGLREYDEQGQLTEESSIKWNKFKNEYGLSDVINEKYGYGVGFVPTFFYVEGKKDTSFIEDIKDASVTFNDTVEKINNEYVVTSSFYTEERLPNLSYLQFDNLKFDKVLKDLKINESYIDEIVYNDTLYITWNKENALSYHEPLLEQFLNFSLESCDDIDFEDISI